MSITVEARPLHQWSRARRADPRLFRIVGWSTTVITVGLLLLATLRDLAGLEARVESLLFWLLLVTAADVVPVPTWENVSLTMSLPILMAAGILFGPAAAGLVAFVGSVDPRELKREVSLSRALFNRSQIALSVMAASVVFASVGARVTDWPAVVPAGMAALATDGFINILAVATGASMTGGVPFPRLLREAFIESGWQFIVGYVCFGLLALLLASMYEFAGTWGLLGSLLPVVLARQMFAHGQSLARASAESREKSRLLVELSERIADERLDERLKIAAGLHDEVLQPLYKVHLMGEVIRRDLDSGRLLELDEDIPELLRATDLASDELRRVIRNLRRSVLGPGGLVSTLRLLLDDVSLESELSIHAELEEVEASSLIQLLVYQIAREAIQNVVRHAKAENLWVELRGDRSEVRLMVRDDGIGFNPEVAKDESHFGLEMMKERANAAQGILHLASVPGEGTQVSARFPTELSLE